LHSQDESEVEKEARSPSQAQEKKDEGEIVSSAADFWNWPDWR
jgi:hypothetical protein